MPRIDEDYDDWLQDLLEEALADERYEYNMRTDYEYFLYQYDSELCELQELVSVIKKAHEQYGWDFDIRDLL